MTFPISPGVYDREIDLTATVPALATSVGGFVGSFRWGPVSVPVLVGSEDDLVKKFGKPRRTDSDFFSAAQFLLYGNALYNVRVTGTGAANAHSGTGTGDIVVKNNTDYEDGFVIPGTLTGVEYIAAFPGVYGNALEVVTAASSAAYADTSFDAYRSFFTAAPGTSNYADGKGKTNDEMHIVVVDKTGLITGIAGTVLETFAFVSLASDAKTDEGASNYYVDVVNRGSNYVRWAGHATDLDKAGVATSALVGTSYASTTPVTAAIVNTLAAGADGAAPVDGDIIAGYDLFADSEAIQVSLLPVGNVSDVVKMYVITDIAEKRQDCVAFVSPSYASVVNNSGDELTDVLADRAALTISTSYGVMTDNWKYIYDKYNDRNLWVPTSSDVAGLCAATDAARAPWFSPAGFNRGLLKNVIKLAWSAKEVDRDALFAKGVNSIINKIGTGVLLFGDKTMLTRPSAFDRINVRRLFITLRTRIKKAAESSLFELNNEFTRNNFKSITDAFLREVKGGQGVLDYLVVVDQTNNTPEVIDRNEFVASIFIKPARSISFIRLNFVAVRTGVNFSEVVGQV